MAKAKKTKTREPETVEVDENGDVLEVEEGGEEVEERRIATLDTLGDDVLSTLDMVTKAKEDDFLEEDDDWWKPEAKGDEIKGIYLGSEKGSGKYTQHGVAIAHPKRKGDVLVKRFNGTRILTKKLANPPRDIPPNRLGVLIRYEGEGKTDSGQRLKHFIVRWFQAGQG